MLKISIIAVAISALAASGGAAALSGSGTRETLIEQDYLDFLTIGADYQYQERDISASSQGKMRLKSQTIDGYIGVDPFKWLMLFATFGGSAAQVGEAGSYNNAKFKWSAGFDVNWWRLGITEPTFLEGELSLKTHVEFAMNSSGSGGEKIDWNETMAALLANYEVYTDRKGAMGKYPYSLALFVGPALSWLDGSYYASKDSSRKVDFHEEHLVGIIGGADLYISHNLSVGAAVQYYDGVTVNVSGRYHF